MSNFTQFGFDQKILKILDEIGFDAPTPIQEQAIPTILERKDVIASAQTGTGKTAAFMLPILHLLTQPDYRAQKGPQILILVPTRELAIQVSDEAKKFSKYLPRTKTVCIYGGVPYPIQKRSLAGHYEILVATPGRLMDHMQESRIDLSNLRMLVLDEADRMLDMGFVDAVNAIVKATPADRQTLLFSATIDQKILPFSKKIQNQPTPITVQADQSLKANIEQKLYFVDGLSHKIELLEHLLREEGINQSIVFTSTIRQAGELADHLQEQGFQSEALHGDMNQRQRTRTINKLRRGDIQYLIATDVAARGIDIPALSHVINFDLPFVAEDFIHRIGRTGRAGASGMAITFATYKEDTRVNQIHKMFANPIEVYTVAGLEPKPREFVRGDSRSSKGRRRGNSSRGRQEFSRKPSSSYEQAPRHSSESNPRSFNESKPREFSESKSRSFNGKPRSFNEGKPRSFNEGKPRDFSEGKPRSFNEGKPRSFNEGKPRDFSEGKPRSFNEGKPRSFNEGKPRFFTESKPKSGKPSVRTNPFKMKNQGQKKPFFRGASRQASQKSNAA